LGLIDCGKIGNPNQKLERKRRNNELKSNNYKFAIKAVFFGGGLVFNRASGVPRHGDTNNARTTNVSTATHI
ncbi:MAG: hypothetical protein ACREIF_09680, partial [Chthoniobacterales bacterium]